MRDPDSDSAWTDTYRVFVLRLWRERPGTPWRAALRPGDDAASLGFADLHQLAAFLLRLADSHDPCGGADQQKRTTDGGSLKQCMDNA